MFSNRRSDGRMLPPTASQSCSELQILYRTYAPYVDLARHAVPQYAGSTSPSRKKKILKQAIVLNDSERIQNDEVLRNSCYIYTN